MSSIFTKIIDREIPAQFVYEDDVCVVLMDKFPSVKGQTLVILKREVDYLFDLTDEEYDHLMRVAKKVAKASDGAFSAARTCLVVEGFEVPHVHVKLYPVNTTDTGLGTILSTTTEASDEQLRTDAESIKAVLEV